MSDQKYSTIAVSLKKGSEIVGCNIAVRDEYAIATFTNQELAKQLFKIDLEKGEDVVFNEKHNALLRKYKGKSKEQIIKIIKEDLKKKGALEFEVNKNGVKQK